MQYDLLNRSLPIFSKESPADIVTLEQGELHGPRKMVTVAAMTVMIMQTIYISAINVCKKLIVSI